MFDIQENLKKLPDKPGVYIHKDKLGQVIYVGKAISLKNRVRQYFQSPKNQPAKVRAMVSHIAEFEYITTASEVEALILECNLIKRYSPKYNVLLRDDKTYPYIRITLEDDYPRIFKTRRMVGSGSKYFGPYSDAGAVSRIIDLFNDKFRLKRCSKTEFPSGHRPCLNAHIGKCDAICRGKVDKDEYRERIERIVEFLNGKDKSVMDDLRKRLEEAAENLEFEKAADYRDDIMAFESIRATQRVVLSDVRDMDVVLTIKGIEQQCVVLFFVRDGKLTGREIFPMSDASQGFSRSEMVSAFIKQYYPEVASGPYNILVKGEPEDKDALEQYLGSLWGHKVIITVPARGEKRALMQLAQKDLIEVAKTIDEKARNRIDRENALGEELHELLTDMGETSESYNDQRYRIEAYDISNINGVDSVGAMVVFKGTKPAKKDYRRFRIKTVEGPDDYESMREVLTRRFRRALEGDASFEVLPDMIFMDGGKGHVSTALEVLEMLQLPIPVVGMVKDDHHRTRGLVYSAAVNAAYGAVPQSGTSQSETPQTGTAHSETPGSVITQAGITQSGTSDHGTDAGASDPEQVVSSKAADINSDFVEIDLKGRSMLYNYVGTIQEEVHRFAIEYHRGLRDRKMLVSVLDNIEGIGPVKRNALLAHFGSVENVKKASKEELCKVKGIRPDIADNIISFFGK